MQRYATEAESLSSVASLRSKENVMCPIEGVSSNDGLDCLETFLLFENNNI